MKTWLANFSWRWIALGVGAYLLFLLTTIPASLFAKRLQAQGLVASGLSGTVWKGRAASLQMRGISLGAVQWQFHPTALLLGRFNLDIQAKRDDGFFDASVSARRGGRFHFTDLRASLPIPMINSLAGMNGGLSGGMIGGWKGTLQLKLDELALENGWPTHILGRIDAAELVGPARQPAAIGSYRIEFTPNAAANDLKDGANEVRGNIASQENAPLDVIGVVHLQPNRQYLIDAQVGTRANAPASIVKALEYLGPADAQGRRPLSLSGSI